MFHHHLVHLVTTFVAAAPTLLAAGRAGTASAVHLGSRVVVAKSAAMRHALDLADIYAPAAVPVVIFGPSGTGKTLLAEYLHAQSGRHPTFAAVTAGEIPATLSESELFGHVTGAFTGAVRGRTGLLGAAGAGTLFLDDCQFMGTEVQAKLLRVLGSGTFKLVGSNVPVHASCRIIVGLRGHPDALVGEGALLPDFRARLGECLIPMAPLAERREDIADLAREFLRRCPEVTGLAGPTGFAAEVMAMLEAAPWPDNVRQLGNAVTRAYLHARPRSEIELGDLPADLSGELRYQRHGSPCEKAMAVRWAVAASGGRRDQAAQLLGVHRNTIARQLREDA